MIVLGFISGFAAAMLFALVWRLVHAWRDREAWLYGDLVASALALVCAWWFVFLAFDLPLWVRIVGPLTVPFFVGFDLYVRAAFAGSLDK